MPRSSAIINSEDWFATLVAAAGVTDVKERLPLCDAAGEGMERMNRASGDR